MKKYLLFLLTLLCSVSYGQSSPPVPAQPIQYNTYYTCVCLYTQFVQDTTGTGIKDTLIMPVPAQPIQYNSYYVGLALYHINYVDSLKGISVSISGSGTINYIPKFTGATSVGNSYLSQGTNQILIPDNVQLIGSTVDNAIDVNGAQMFNSHGFASIDWNNNYLLDADGTTQLLHWGSGNVNMGSLFNFNNNGGYAEFKANDNTGKPFVLFNDISASGVESYFLGDLTINYMTSSPIHGLSVYPQITVVDTVTATMPLILGNNDGYGLIRAFDNSNNEFFRINDGSAPGNVSYIKGDFTVDYLTNSLFGGFGVQGAAIIQTTGTAAPNATAVLDLESTTKGLLPPQMTTLQKLAIATPAPGLMVYDLTLNQMSYYNGTTWINF